MLGRIDAEQQWLGLNFSKHKVFGYDYFFVNPNYLTSEQKALYSKNSKTKPMEKQQKKFSIRELISLISPVLINPTKTSLTVSLSKRFLLFQILGKLTQKIEDDPYLNFISILKNYKVLGKILNGTVYEFHRDRNKLYFKNFFIEKEVWELVKQDLEWLVHENENTQDIRMTLTKRGVIIYDNYKKHNFNLLLMTIHGGTWMPKDIQKKMFLTKEERYKEEDIATNRIYSKLVLRKGGIWIDNKQSRFACDFNRNPSRCVYKDGSETWIEKIWKEELDGRELRQLYESYNEFYFTMANLVDAYNFNIIIDCHTMKDVDNRPNVSFGTKYTSTFYMPILLSIKKKLQELRYNHIAFDKPFAGSYIVQWLNHKFPHAFIFSIELSKKLYMNKKRDKIFNAKLRKLSEDITKIFDIEVDAEELVV